MSPGYSYEVPSEIDETFKVADMEDDTLQNFFSRPIKTQAYGWGTGTNLFEKFNPWSDFFENDRVINRISNYHLLRCKLHVKFVLNGNGFHYGRAIASYIPLPKIDGFTKDRTFFQADIVGASQRPHVYLNPTESEGGELVLPFVWPYNALDIPQMDWRDMGEMVIHGMQNLKHANGANDSVTVSVFVWAEDVKLAVPTADEPGALAPQAGEYIPQADEYGQGVVSKPASIIARAAGLLSNAPVIGAYARATEVGASAVASISSAFGFSRPAVIKDIEPFRPTYMGNMANTNMPDSTTKLTLDAKQEVTIDTRTMGLDGTDEMTIKSIATRESYLTQFPWLVAGATENLLWNCEVNPVIWENATVESTLEYHMPACCYAALPFEHWRGTMKYRFQIVASAFHKGRLKVVYDPSYPVTNEYNTNYTRIIDLAEERDFTVEIGWGSQYPYLRHRDMIKEDVPNHNTSPLGADPDTFGNGVLSIFIVNELTVPNSEANNDIAINVFVSAGDDFEVANPTDQYIHESSWFPQAGEYVPQAGEEETHPDADATLNENAPMKLNDVEPSETVGAELTCRDHTNDIFYGDPISSFRQILKRYNFSMPLTVADPDDGYHRWYIPDLPVFRGADPNGLHNTSVGAIYTYAKFTMLNWLVPAYTCYRGGLRWKYHFDTADQELKHVWTSREADKRQTTGYWYQRSPLPNNSGTTSYKAFAAEFAFFSGADGAHAVVSDQNPVLEVEYPYYNNERFKYAKEADYINSTTNVDYHWIMAMLTPAGLGRDQIYGYCAAAEDFTLGFYTGPPVLYRAVAPAAVGAP